MDDTTGMINDLNYLTTSKSYICAPEECCTYVQNDITALKIFHMNIRSIGSIANFNNFLILIKRLNLMFDILILSECWLSKCTNVPSIPGFKCYKSKYFNQNDGVVAYVRLDIPVSIEDCNIIDASCILVKLSTSVAVLAVYRSPSIRNINGFINSLDKTLTKLKSFKTMLLIGDLNIDISENVGDAISDLYLNVLASHGMLPAHLFPTRENNCIDHAILKSDKPAISLVLDTQITDHRPIVIFCNSEITRKKNSKRRKHVNIPACVTNLESVDFSPVLTAVNPNIAASKLVNIISDVVKSNTTIRCVPNKAKIIKPWITCGLLRCIRNRDKLYIKSKRNPNNFVLKKTYTRYRNFCNNLLKKLKREYEKNEFLKHRNNPKATWKHIKNISNITNDRSSASDLLSLKGDPMASANAVNEFFANVGKSYASKITNKSNTSRNKQRPSITTTSSENSMTLFGTDIHEVIGVINGLRGDCAVGWDDIPAALIKAAGLILAPVLCHVFNTCIDSGIFPTVFKKALVHPIHKNGDKMNITNYRPISVLSTLSKIFEKLLNKRLLNYLKTYNIIAQNQYGFRSGRGTEDAALELTSTILEHLNNKAKTLAIFLDLSKAFDTVSVPILLSKLEVIGIRGHSLKIFQSYLSNRSQIVTIDNTTSEEASVTYGVPQGSVLGPTLFLLYINELCLLKIKNTNIVTYADDTAVVVHGDNWIETRLCAEEALATVSDWLKTNLLTLNMEKTRFVTFSPRNVSQPPLSFSLTVHQCHSETNTHDLCPKISRTNAVKYLGLKIDGTLSWQEHINDLVGKVRKLIFVFRKLRTSSDLHILKMVYYALAHSVITYCIVVWGGCRKGLLLRLERAQRAVLKVISKKPIRFPTEELYDICKVPRVRQSFIRSTLLRKHLELVFDPNICSQTRRQGRVCKIYVANYNVVRSHYRYLSSILYNKINKLLNIYPLISKEVKIIIDRWLFSLTYEDMEELLE